MQDKKYGMTRGVEDLTHSERFVKAVNAGVDQIGDSEEPVCLVRAPRIVLLTMDLGMVFERFEVCRQF